MRGHKGILPLFEDNNSKTPREGLKKGEKLLSLSTFQLVTAEQLTHCVSHSRKYYKDKYDGKVGSPSKMPYFK